ncbi:MAG: hypothetical protein AMXMBFR64_34540 [Myxococcales bacterium]
MMHRALRACPLLAIGLAALLVAGCPDKSDDGGDGTTGPGGGGGGGGDTVAPKPVTDYSKFSTTTLTGFVFNAVSGKPIQNATVSTEPPTESVQTTSTGLFSINIGHAFGVVTIKAAANGYRQQQQTCINLKPGLNTLADISLVKTDSATDGDCVPPCTGSTTCVSGVCISACNPLCGCGDLCDPTAPSPCLPDPNFVSSAICENNSHPAGKTMCECDLGYVPAGDGRTCLLPGNIEDCGSNAIATATGCECENGYLPDVKGDGCIPADEAAAPGSLAGNTVVREWPTPGPSPRGIAFDGQTLWLGDAAHEVIYRVQPDGSVIKDFDIGAYAKALRDMTFGNGYVYFTVTTGADGAGLPQLIRMSATDGTIKHIDTANNFQTTEGITFDGAYLDSLEGLTIKRRSPDLGSNVFPTNVVLTGGGSSQGQYTVVDGVRFLANTQNQFIGWVGTRYDGNDFLAQFVTLNAVHKTQSAELGRLELPVGGSHVAGIELFGTRMWVVAAGSGKDTPKVVEVKLD